MPAEPVVSIIVPTRNRAHMLRRALQGIAEQTFQEFECLIVDDGSTVENRDACAAIVAELDGRFRFLPSAVPGVHGTGAASTRNRGIRESRGEFVTFCDDDDLWSTADHLDAAMRVLRQGADRTFFFSNQEGRRDGKVTIPDWYPGQDYLRNGPRVLDQPAIYEVPRATITRFLGNCCPHLNTVIVRRDALERTGLFWERAAFGEDWNMVMRLADIGQRFFYRPDATVTFTAASSNSLFNDTPLVERSLMMIMAAQHVRYTCRDRVLQVGARKAEGWHLRELARFQADQGQHRTALSYVMQALWVCPTPNAAISALRHGWHAVAGRQ